MRKAEEIQMLREVAKVLGPNSYCGPWLASVADEVEYEVRSDFFPTPSIAATRKECENLKADAIAEAGMIEAVAREKANKIASDADDRASRIRDRAAIALRSALVELEERL